MACRESNRAIAKDRPPGADPATASSKVAVADGARYSALKLFFLMIWPQYSKSCAMASAKRSGD